MKHKLLCVPLISLLALSLAGCTVEANSPSSQEAASASSSVSKIPVTDLGNIGDTTAEQKANIQALTVKVSELFADRDFAASLSTNADMGSVEESYKDKYAVINDLVEDDASFEKEYKLFLEKSREGDTVISEDDAKIIAKSLIVVQTFQLEPLMAVKDGVFGVDLSNVKTKEGQLVLDKAGSIYVQDANGLIRSVTYPLGISSFNTDGTKLTANTILSDRSKYEESNENYMQAHSVKDAVQEWLSLTSKTIEDDTDLSAFVEEIFTNAEFSPGTELSITGTPTYYKITMEIEGGGLVTIDSDDTISMDENDPLNLESSPLAQAWETYESMYLFESKDNKNLTLDDVAKASTNAENPKGSVWNVEQLDNGEKYVKVVIDGAEYKLYDVTSVVG